MHLAAVAGIFSIPPLAFIFTPTGRSILATAWTWLKGVLGKLTPKGILFVVRKKSHQGDELDVLFSTHDPEAIARLLQGSSAALLKGLPAALGADCPRPPYLPSRPEPVQSPLLPQLAAPQLLEANDSQPGSAKPTVPERKRPGRLRAGRRPQSARRMGARCGSHRSASLRKR